MIDIEFEHEPELNTEEQAELTAHLNEWSLWNGEDDDPDGSLAEAELKELNAYWYASRGVR